MSSMFWISLKKNLHFTFEESKWSFSSRSYKLNSEKSTKIIFSGDSFNNFSAKTLPIEPPAPVAISLFSDQIQRKAI